MKDTDQTPIVLSREDLYELAWSKPISELARDFAVSDVALAKRCRRLGIPLPGRGYWARVDAGQKPYRPKLSKREEQWRDAQALTVPLASKDEDTPRPEGREATQDELWLAERLAFEERSENAIVVEQPPSVWDPVVRIHRDNLRAEAKAVLESRVAHERYEKLPESRKRGEWNNDGYKWRSLARSGQRLLDYHKPRAFRVTMQTLERALAITNAIATAGKIRGFTLRNEEKDGRIAVVGHAGEVQFRMTEQLEVKVRPSDWRKGETEKYKVPTGRLRITMTDGWREGPIFEDKGSVKLETQLNRFFAAAYKAVVKQRQQARETKIRQEQEKLEEMRRVAQAKIRAEEERKAASERKRREALSLEAQRWEQAERIRRYVACVRETVSETNGLPQEVDSGEVGVGSHAKEGWIQWALAVANDLDPTADRQAKLTAGGAPE